MTLTRACPPSPATVNEAMPAYAVDLLGDVDGARVLILGVAYRGGVKETAFSGAFGLRDELAGGERPRSRRTRSTPATSSPALGFEPWHGEDVDLAVLQADHPEYARLGAGELPGVRIVVDGRGALDPARFAGVEVRRIGRP